ncbi:hypothetical protein OKW43_007814 [Paraburkholderia sp. WC7.3g]|uniref:hypothetical protein n=1 Tax=Paraburkholderia sp. WC7.3g TaxID=2991070 RepID=UPI003D1B827A
MTNKRFDTSCMLIGVCLLLAVSNACAQSTACVSAQQHAESEARITAMTQGFDPARLGHNLSDAGQQRMDALDAVKKCQSGAVLGMGCGREIDLYNLADEEYKNATQAIDMYRMLVSSQLTARSMESPVCR